MAGLALGVAQAASAFAQGCDERLREHLRAVPNPGRHVDVLAEILGEELAEWQDGDWLVLDEYQELAASREAERFVAELLAASRINLLIASRQRPAWVTARSILYGEVLELNQTVLAMDSREAAEMLAGRSTQSAPGLVALANGWPAVIALASVSSAELEGEDEVPESLYHFFAEEVFAALGDEVRSGIAALAIAPVLDRALADELLGPERADPVLSAALEVGLLVEHDARLEIHPLARAFLEERSEHLAHAADPDMTAMCLAYYRARRDWDAAFDLIARRGPTEELEPLLREALDELLDTARLPTIGAWCEFAAKCRFDAPVFAIARAEVSLRQGRHAEAQSAAESAALTESDLEFRALSVAGRAAHLASREEEALDLYQRAEHAARTHDDHRDAQWGQVMCLIDLERPEAIPTLDALTAGVRRNDPREAVRAAAHRLYSQLKFGALDLGEADVAAQLVPMVGDPLVESGFQSVYAAVLALSARYEDAHGVAMALLATAHRYQFDFAIPYALCSAAISAAGLRDWTQAAQHLDHAIHDARSTSNAHAEQLCLSAQLRVLCQQGRHEEALALDFPQAFVPIAAIRAELLASHALALAAASRADEALNQIEDLRARTQAIEPTVLVSAVEALVALRQREPRAVDRVVALEEAAFSTGGYDLLVSAYRTAPELLAVLLRRSPGRERVVALVRRVHDEDLVRVIGQPLGSGEQARDRLSQREKEVYDLLCQGLTNRQIGEVLFISESTVKVHAHHIYDKLGLRSRTALAVQAALRRSDQATSATDTSGSGTTS